MLSSFFPNSQLVNSLQDTGLTSLGGEITKKRAKADRNDVLRKSKSGNIMPITARQEDELPTKAGSVWQSQLLKNFFQLFLDRFSFPHVKLGSVC